MILFNYPVTKEHLKIAIIGTGSMGSIYAGHLSSIPGNQVWIFDSWKKHLKVIKNHGLKMNYNNSEQVIKNLQIGWSIENVGSCDLIVLATKAFGIEKTLKKTVSHLLGPNTILLTMQNGLGIRNQIQKYISSNNVLFGVAQGFGASMKNYGYIHHNAMALIRLGELEKKKTFRLKKISNIWSRAGFKIEIFNNISTLIWDKFLCNVAYSAPCTVWNRNVEQILKDIGTRNVVSNCAKEAFNVGCAYKVSFSFTDPTQYIIKFGHKMPLANPSMFQDHKNKKKSEIDFINGAVCKMGKYFSISTPFNQVLSEIVLKREYDWI